MEPKILKRLDGYPPHEPAEIRARKGMHAMGGAIQSDDPWAAHTYAAELVSRGEDPHVRVRCDCGRTRPAFAVLDVRALPPEIRGSADWACDACVSEWRTRAELSIAALAANLGAPEAMVAALQVEREVS